MMGLIFYYYVSIQGSLWTSKVVHGDRRDYDNLFSRDSVMLNLKGDPE